MPTPVNPAPHVSLRAILVLDDGPPVLVTTSYQFQSWGGTRKETRITGNLQAIRGPSATGDILLMERGRVDPDEYRLTVLRQGHPLYEAALARTGPARWGTLAGGMPVISTQQVEQAVAEIGAVSAAPFKMFDADAQLQSQGKRIARSRAFRIAVIDAYGGSCAMCGGGARSPSGVTELEAAHVVPRAQKGADDIRNGLSLCRLHHWAFDRQLIGISMAGEIRIPAAVAAIPQNAGLAAIDGQPLVAPANVAFGVHPDALAWAAARYDEFWA